MDITSLYSVGSEYIKSAADSSSLTGSTGSADFGSVLSAAMDNINQTSALEAVADEEKMKWAMGLSENSHDMTIAMSKAGAAIDYTVAIRDKFLEAYREIMNMQI